MSDTFFQSSSSPGTTEGAGEGAVFESVTTPIHAGASVQRDPNGAPVPLKITGSQTINNSDQLHKALTAYLDGGDAVAVDLSEVDECDTAALQLIYALRQSAVHRKQRFHITAVSPAITGTAAALGLHIEALTTGCGLATAGGVCEVASESNGI